MIGLIDCNNFFASCERVFNPALNGRPIVVLSNNDGCVIARSEEVKPLGVKMGVPFYQIKELVKKENIAVFSSNYILYGDLSRRVMSILADNVPDIDVYSIDEAFLDLSGINDLSNFGTKLVKTTSRGSGIPVSLGIASTRTLAKLANRFAKKYLAYNRVCIIDSEEKRIKALQKTSVGDIWGIGRRTTKMLEYHSVNTAYDLSDEEREFYYEYEKNTDNPKIEYFNKPQSLTLEEMNKKFNSAVIKQFEKARYEKILQKMNSKQIGKQQNVALHHKFNYLIHLFCSKCTNNEDGYTKINSELLKKAIGDEYNIALYTLLHIGFIDTDGSYIIGRSSRMYHLKDKYISSIKTISENNPKIKKYIDKSFKEIETYKKARFQRLSDRDKFVIERYNSYLSRLKMTLIDECGDFIYNNKEYDIRKPIQKKYYKNIYNQYLYQKNGLFQIIQVDNNSRIYHILTSTPKDLRKYLNIKYTIDIKNSHPLLLNKLLLIYYYNKDLFNNIINKKIEYFKYIDIYNILTSNINTDNHHVSDNLHNNLKYNNIDKLLLDAFNIPPDVRKYINKTSQGQMWEELLDACEENGLKADDRSELKAKMFSEVFYSKTRTTIYKDYGKVFKSIYPNVYKVINELKPNGQETKLSHILMRLESELFYQILERIYKETEYEAINMHDAIIILDTSKNESCTTDDIESIMRDIYNAYNLFPTFSNE